jgi:hypothetical protein
MTEASPTAASTKTACALFDPATAIAEVVGFEVADRAVD